MAVGDELDRSEVDRREQQGIVGVGESIDIGYPTCGGHCHPEVVEHGAATKQRLPAGVVSRVQDAVFVLIEVDGIAIEYPAPGLAVVQRGCAAGQCERLFDYGGIDHGVSHIASLLA